MGKKYVVRPGVGDPSQYSQEINLISPDGQPWTALQPRTLSAGRTIVLGDSVDEGARGASPVPNDDAGQSWFSEACIRSGQRMRFYRNAGVAGETTTQMLARVNSDVIAYSPDYCVIGGPTNDHGADFPESTTRANYAAMVNILRAAGITPVIRNAVPIGNANKYKIERHNAWLASWGLTQGIHIMDVYTPMVDVLTGGPKAGFTTDGIHPSATGRAAIAAAVAANLPAFFRGSVPLTTNQTDAANLATGGTFAVDTDANGYADGWVLGGGTFTPSLVADATILGQWQQSSIATTGLGYWQQQITTGWAVGDRVAIGALIDKPAGTSVSVSLAYSGGTKTIALLDNAGAFTKGTLWAEGVIPAGTTTVHARVSMNLAAGSVKIGRLTALNLTALGL